MNQKKYSLYSILALIIIVMATISITLFSTYNYIKTKKELIENIKHTSNDSGTKLQYVLGNYIESYSVSEYEYLLKIEMKNKNIYAIIVHDYNVGKIMGKEYFITGKIRDNNWNIVKYNGTQEEIHLLNTSFYKEKKEIQNSKGTKIGDIFIYSSHRFINGELLSIVYETILSVLLISFLLIVIFFLLIKHIILKPIKNIASIITQNSTTDIPLQPIPENGFKEIYQLSNTINKMIYSIQESQKSIAFEVEKNKQKDILLHNQSRFAAMGEMIGNIAHQWRQPLNALSITIQKVQRFYQIGKLDEEIMDKSIDKSMKLIDKMSSTIDDFMGFFRKDKIKMPFDIATAINETISLLEASIKNSFIDLKFEEPSEPIMFEGYKGELTQVILNIVSNAKDALKEKKVVSPKIDIKIQSTQESIKIDIIDNGGGIDKNIIGNIFDPYFTTKKEGQGTGIGLYMSKIIIEQNMGGKLSVVTIDNGACFTISLKKDKGE